MSSLNQKLERAIRSWLIATAGTPPDGSLGPKGYTMVTNENDVAVVNENENEEEEVVTTAIVTHLGSRFLLNWYVGETTEVIKLPAVVVVSETAEEDPDLNRNFFCDVDVYVRLWGHDWASYPDVVETLELFSEQIRAALLRDDMPDEITTMEPAFACQGVVSRSAGREVEGRVRMHRYSLRLYCTEADLIAA